MRFVRVSALLVGSAVLVGVIAAGAGARSANYVEIKLGDQVRIAGTRTVCLSAKEDTNGRPGVGCALFAGGAPLAGSFAPSLVSDGTVMVERITKGGATTVYRHTLGVRSASKTYVLRSGDQFALPVGGGKAVGCSIVTVAGLVGPVCQYATKKAPVGDSYGYFISGQQAVVIQYDSSGKSSRAVKRYQQPR